MADERQGADCEDIDAGKTDQAPLDKRELELRGDRGIDGPLVDFCIFVICLLKCIETGLSNALKPRA